MLLVCGCIGTSLPCTRPPLAARWTMRSTGSITGMLWTTSTAPPRSPHTCHVRLVLTVSSQPGKPVGCRGQLHGVAAALRRQTEHVLKQSDAHQSQSDNSFHRVLLTGAATTGSEQVLYMHSICAQQSSKPFGVRPGRMACAYIYIGIWCQPSCCIHVCPALIWH